MGVLITQRYANNLRFFLCNKANVLRVRECLRVAKWWPNVSTLSLLRFRPSCCVQICYDCTVHNTAEVFMCSELLACTCFNCSIVSFPYCASLTVRVCVCVCTEKCLALCVMEHHILSAQAQRLQLSFHFSVLTKLFWCVCSAAWGVHYFLFL